MELQALLLLSLVIGSPAMNTCDSGEIKCPENDLCVPHYFLCDTEDDCSDGADEDTELCAALTSSSCGVGDAFCTVDGSGECISVQRYCDMNDPPCQGDFDWRVCEMLEGGVIAGLGNFTATPPLMNRNLNKSREMGEEFVSNVPFTLTHERCPPMYTLVDDYCISIFHIGSMSWSESRKFCKLLGGDLITFPDVNRYSSVVRHLREYGMTSDFWIGGMMEDLESGWTWIDGSPMPLGSPYWAARYHETCVDRNVTSAPFEDTCYQYQQAPASGSKGQCVSLSFEHFYFMAEDSCVKKMSPLCAYMGVEEFAIDALTLEK